MNKPAPPLESMKAVGWKYWRAMLKGQEFPTHPAFVPLGFYRLDNRATSRRAASSYPVAVYEVDAQGNPVPKSVQMGHGEPFVIGNDPAAEEDFSFKTFAKCCRNAITHETYLYWLEHREWPNDQATAAIAASEAPRSNTESTPDLVLRETIAELRAEAERWLASIGGSVTNQHQADKAADFASRFAELEKEADEARTSGRRPHLERAEQVQKTWQPIAQAGAASKTWAKELTVAWQKAEKARILREAAEKAAAGEVVALGALKVKAGTRGRAVSMRSRVEYRCDSYDAVFAHFKDDPRLKAHLLVVQACGQLAKAALEAGETVPGARLETVESAA
ncbi:hypothetical protein JRF84_08230 [Methylobacterium organophilum]|uniref:hypothetical protein n=1 Tax=Methylobacterium organophilum TaxID=410 RepID=UPI0019D2671C|nr:hypothetical protein [Methylobacterium organophilum]MBN6819576.1 hypothetical protein [Methylobacterium organophilum]